jgi:MFS family permease
MAGDYASLMRDPRFVRLWLAGALAGTMRWLEMLVIGVFTFQLTGSPSAVALMTFARLGPMLVLGLPAGAVADRYDRKWVFTGGLVILTLVASTLLLLALGGRLALWQVALGAAINGTFWAGEFPIRRTMMGEIVGRERVAPAMALDSLTSNATRAIGPLAGGALYQMVGLEGAFALGILCYAGAALLVAPIAYRAETRLRSGVISGVVEGLGFVRRSRLVTAIMVVTVVFNVLGFAYIALVPVVGEETLRLSAFLIGVLMAIEGVGSLLGALVVGAIATPARYTRIYVVGTGLFLAAIVAFALSRSFPLALLALFVSGLGLSGFAVMQGTLVFVTAPAAMRSRMMGVLTVGIGTGPLGMLAIGWLAEIVSPPDAILLMAGSGCLALAVTVLLWPELWSTREPLGAAQAEDAPPAPQPLPSRPADNAG